ncbi:hypothetical protein, partial [Enterobacter sp. PGRG2]|uniref:hypothetical protein n=1 Tax=Enterobacter sp. PGRG2 TaxID=3104013 RepID=UPI002ABE69F8
NVLALTEALEAAQSRIAEFKARAEAAEKRYENRTPTEWAYGQACAAIENHRARADAAEARISELEARTLTVKLPRRRTYEDYADARFSNADLAAIHNVTVSSMIRIFEENCAAAGISLKIEGE